VLRSWIGGADGGYDLTKIVETSLGIYRIDWDVDREIVLAEPFFSYVVHDAVAAAGRCKMLPALLRVRPVTGWVKADGAGRTRHHRGRDKGRGVSDVTS
jgi:hypothetical protein